MKDAAVIELEKLDEMRQVRFRNIKLFAEMFE